MPTVRFLSALTAIPMFALAAVVPTGPGPNNVFQVGSYCSIEWTIDNSATWTNMTIDLMSGSNDNVTFVARVAQGLDGTDPKIVPFNWTCPDVQPYAPIYFYQFTQYDLPETQWTARFTISSPTGEQIPAAHAIQSNGAAIPWGVGQIRGPSASSAPSSHAGESAQSNSSEDPDSVSPSDGSTAEAPAGTADSDTQLSSPGASHSGSSSEAESRSATSGPTRSRRPHSRPSGTASSASAPTLAIPPELDADRFYANGAGCAHELLPSIFLLVTTIAMIIVF